MSPLRTSVVAAAVLFALWLVSYGSIAVAAYFAPELCFLGGCEDQPESHDLVFLIALLSSLLVFAVSPFVAARLSGWDHPFGVGVLALVALVVSLWFGAALVDGLEAVAALWILALLLVVGIAVRPASRSVVGARVVAGSGLLACALLFEAFGLDDAAWLGVLAVAPAIALADVLALRRMTPPAAAVH